MSKTIAFLKRHFFIFLLIVVCLSYGQLLWMQPWQDDNALIFKLLNIDEAAGFLGKGVLGEGPYRYVATPYYLLYKMVGLNIVAFYALALSFYFFSVIAVYYLFKNLISVRAGMIASFLYATNYVTSDGFIRLFNSVSSSIGVILLSLLISSYWKFFQTKRNYYYFASLIIYFLACELVYVRFHYLFGFLFITDMVLSSSFKSVKLLFKTLFRMIPFMLIFIWLYIAGGDSRSNSAIKNLFNIAANIDFFSLFNGFGQIIIPDRFLTPLLSATSFITSNPYYQIILMCFFVLVIFNSLCFWLIKENLILKVGISIVSLICFFISRFMFQKLPPTTSFSTLFIGFMGMIFYLGLFILGSNLPIKKRKLFFVFLFLTFISIFSYILYDSTLFYGTYNNRYLTHVFIGLIGVLTILITSFNSKLLVVLVLGIGVTNLLANISYQYEIRITRSDQISHFYESLKRSVPNLSKGSVVYFDLEDNSLVHTRYSDAITSSQMPETTAIAWRYGLDRYDFDLVTNYDDLQKVIIQKNIPIQKVHSFFYSRNGLINTSPDLKKENFSGKSVSQKTIESNPILSFNSKNTNYEQDDITIDFNPPVSSVLPTKIKMIIRADLIDLGSVKYPMIKKGISNSFLNFPEDQKPNALNYQEYKNDLLKSAEYKSSNNWQKRTVENITDANTSTYWQSDRVTWQKSSSYIVIDLKQIETVNRLVWINGFSNNTPTEYIIESSMDGKKWFEVKKVYEYHRLQTEEWKVIEFNPQEAQFLKITFIKTFTGDSPTIAEVWPVSVKYKDLDLIKTEEFLKYPLNAVSSSQSFNNIVTILKTTFKVRYSWLSNKSTNWQLEQNSFVDIIYDGLPHEYTILVPAGGTILNKLKLSEFSAPGKIIIQNIDLGKEAINYETN